MSDTANATLKKSSISDNSSEVSLNEVEEFLYESNKIERVFDLQSLKQAMKAWQYLGQWEELTKQNILKTHAILMRGKLDREDTGRWRRCPVWIGGREAKHWYRIPALMDQWIKQANGHVHTDWLHKATTVEGLIKEDHVKFESIHPFVDGNGRLGRLLFLWQRIKLNLPVVIIKEEEKADYYEWFKQ